MSRRNGRQVMTDGRRGDILRSFYVTERDIERLKRLPLDDAEREIREGLEGETNWAMEKCQFLTRELKEPRALAVVSDDDDTDEDDAE